MDSLDSWVGRTIHDYYAYGPDRDKVHRPVSFRRFNYTPTHEVFEIPGGFAVAEMFGEWRAPREDGDEAERYAVVLEVFETLREARYRAADFVLGARRVAEHAARHAGQGALAL